MRVISGFRRGVNEICALLGFYEDKYFFTEVSGQPIGPIFKSQAVQQECLEHLGMQFIFYIFFFCFSIFLITIDP